MWLHSYGQKNCMIEKEHLIGPPASKETIFIRYGIHNQKAYCQIITMSTLPGSNQETRPCHQSLLEWTPPNSDSESSPMSSQEVRKNTIYVRIKRISKRKDTVPSQMYTRVHFNRSVLVPDVQLQIINHFHDQFGTTADRHSIVDDNGRATRFVEMDLSNAKIEMIRKLLHLEAGPLAWSSLDDNGTPPENFVWYLTSVLSKAVEMYLRQDTGKVYWIKHVSFWSDFLNPNGSWWSIGEGSVYKATAESLRNSLHSRMRKKPFIDCSGDKEAQNILLRACILFARKSISDHKI